MASRALPLCCALLVAACARTTLQSSVADVHGGTKPTEEMDFWDGLAVQPAVSNRDAIHALMLSFVRRARAEQVDWQIELKDAERRGWISAGDAVKANETARVGMVARVVCMEANIRGGATMRVLGPVERYAVKELNFQGWLRDMTPGQSISGAELIAVLSKAEDQRKGAGTGPKEDM